jgi:acyl-CoA thioester hydrolase
MSDERLPSAEIGVRVAFYDLDPMNVVWHGRYPQYFELARCELLERIGYGYEAMASSGYAWPVIDLRIRYARPARYGQQLRVRAQIAEYEHRLRITYEIRDAKSGERVTRGYTSQVAVRLSNGEMLMASPAPLLEAIGRHG